MELNHRLTRRQLLRRGAAFGLGAFGLAACGNEPLKESIPLLEPQKTYLSTDAKSNFEVKQVSDTLVSIQKTNGSDSYGETAEVIGYIDNVCDVDPLTITPLRGDEVIFEVQKPDCVTRLDFTK